MAKRPEEYEGLQLEAEYPATKKRTFILRLYRTPIEGYGYRYHFGFPRDMVAGLDPVLRTAAGWLRPHWTEHDDFWIWSTQATGGKPPRAELNRLMRAMIQKFNRLATITQYRKGKGKG